MYRIVGCKSVRRFVKSTEARTRKSAILFACFAMVPLAVAGCSSEQAIGIPGAASVSSAATPMAKMAAPNPNEIVFKDDVQSNVDAPAGLDGLVFLDTQGDRVALESFLGRKNVVLVFTEGFGGGMLCPFCKTQTSRLVANYDKFAELDTEVLVVYPGTRDHLDEFIDAATRHEKEEVDQIPFPLVLDEDLSAVGFFKIASNLAHPSTFIIDKRGDVRLAYVGADMTADRPSIASILGILASVKGP